MASVTPSSSSSSRSRHREGETREVIVGNFTRLGQIGQGSFATVYRAKHVKRGSLVAIKSVILARLNKKLKDNLFSEINILRELHHPHIVGLFDCRETSSNIHLVMEYCPMGDLAYFMRKREQYARHEDFARAFQKYPNPKAGGLHEVIARHFFQQLASALIFLRSKDLIHRDVKPQNLLIVPPRSYYDKPRQDTPYFPGNWTATTPVGVETLPVLKLADFGFARSLPKTALAETLCGSPLYMAPEILRYEKYDAKADLWSVGTVTYEMLTGRPPFRAANHIELLRKIESSHDNIKFPDEPQISAEMRRIVCALLKRGPAERISFEDFFDDTTIKYEIPGLVDEDRRRPKPSRTTPSDSGNRPPRSLQLTRMASSKETTSSDSQEKFHDAVDYTNTQRPPMREAATTPGTIPQSRVVQAQDSRHTSSPNPASAATGRRVEAQAMRRTSSRDTPQPPIVREARDSATLVERERAAQDVAFERDYVVVEKRAVEVNAFADEMAASPRVNRTTGRRESNPPLVALPRRNTTSNTPPQVGALSSTPGRTATTAPGVERRPEHARRESLSKTGRQGSSTTSAISKAVAKASGRLFSFGISPPVSIPLSARGTPSPPVHAPFPSYPITGNSLLAGDSKSPQPLDEDIKVLQAIEETAHRSDVVYSFAEVKYKQLIPLAPSVSGDGLGLRDTGKDNNALPTTTVATEDDDGLTADAIVQLSEEAFVLYIKSLSLLAHSMDVAGAWWMRKNRSEASGVSGTSGTSGAGNLSGGSNPETSSSSAPNKSVTSSIPSSASAARMNKVVQWTRDRFNEILEKAEFVRLKLIAAQKRLPRNHPSHPDNHPVASAAGASDMSGAADDVHITPGVSAEKLMYVRALEMGKTAAVNELVCDDLMGCEIAYVTAIRMLEAVLDTTDDETLPRKIAGDAEGNEAGGAEDKEKVVEAADREQIRKVVQGFHARLVALRHKLQTIAERQAAMGAAGAAGSAGSSVGRAALARSPVQGARSPAQRSPVQRSPVLANVQMAGAGAAGSPRSR